MIPYIEIPPLSLGGYIIVQPFGLLVAIGCVVGWWMVQREARAKGLDARVVDGMTFWALVIGFPSASMLDVLFYHPNLLKTDPTAIFRFWDYMSSYGGFIGGAVAAVIYLRIKRAPLLSYLDALAVGLVVGWFFGRLGCTIVHDHPGSVTTFPLGVRYPDAVRHDLGLYEWLYTIALLAILLALPRGKMPAGAVAALVLILYAPIRFMLDFLRVADITHLSLTPGQYASAAVAILGIWLLRHVYARVPKSQTVASGQQL